MPTLTGSSIAKAKSKGSTKAQDAYRQIKEALLTGQLKPGERLVEARICEAFGLRRGPVREALMRLDGEGLIRKQGAYRGARG